jgi:hypothetical protein
MNHIGGVIISWSFLFVLSNSDKGMESSKAFCSDAILKEAISYHKQKQNKYK